MWQCRALQALERSGLKPKFLEETPFDGMVSLTRGITMRFTKTTQHIVHRLQLAMHLIAAAEEAYPGQITYHFDHSLDRVDFDQQQASFTRQNGQHIGSFSYDLLIGADGANSRVRDLLHVSTLPPPPIWGAPLPWPPQCTPHTHADCFFWG